jgi:hypothetical protein
MKQSRKSQFRSRLLAMLLLRRNLLAAENAKRVAERPTAQLELTEVIPGTKLTRQELLAMDRKWLVFHEAGHFVVARHFKAAVVESRIWETEAGPTARDNGIVGVTEYRLLRRFSPLMVAAFGWAGGLAEQLAQQTFEDWEDNLGLYWDDWEQLEISPKDRADIASHPKR